MDRSDKGSLGAELTLNYNALSAMQSRYVLLCNELYIDESFCDEERAELLKACDSEQEIIERIQQYLEHQETRPGFAEMRKRLTEEEYDVIESIRLQCVKQVKKFRNFHYEIVQKYVMRFNSMTGTGGTDLNQNLRQ